MRAPEDQTKPRTSELLDSDSLKQFSVQVWPGVAGVGPGGGAAAAQELPRHAGGQRGGHAALKREHL